ncbi:MAG TPA: hypothetical protein VEY67_02205 [Candidatus Dormibacteraeota bacterium]|nr:hypothetical protein [Candidatus Dormibacteraeota bacterium]
MTEIDEATGTMALPLADTSSEPNAYGLAAQRIRRCTFRRLTEIEVAGDRVYDVACLYPDRRRPIPLGDLESATPICNSCTAAHIFRPDED